MDARHRVVIVGGGFAGLFGHDAWQAAAPALKSLAGVAPVAMQQGRYAADLIGLRFQGQSSPPFHYRDRGSMTVIGRNAAVADLGWLWLAGLPAWLLGLFIHLLYLVQFQNRLLVLTQWAWSYFGRNRSALLIPEEPGNGTGKGESFIPASLENKR